jgi:hypothetical protein
MQVSVDMNSSVKYLSKPVMQKSKDLQRLVGVSGADGRVYKPTDAQLWLK